MHGCSVSLPSVDMEWCTISSVCSNTTAHGTTESSYHHASREADFMETKHELKSVLESVYWSSLSFMN